MCWDLLFPRVADMALHSFILTYTEDLGIGTVLHLALSTCIL